MRKRKGISQREKKRRNDQGHTQWEKDNHIVAYSLKNLMVPRYFGVL